MRSFLPSLAGPRWAAPAGPTTRAELLRPRRAPAGQAPEAELLRPRRAPAELAPEADAGGPSLAAEPAGHADLATPLSEVTFVVIDLETTGTAPGQNRIIEVGAAKYRGGECLGTFQTLVNPGCPVPPFIEGLTGITQALLRSAPPIDVVLPTLVGFMGDAVLVGHNLRFDTLFLDADLAANGRPQLGQARIDTLTLSRSLLPRQVPDHRLSTLAGFFRTAARPTHRALDDALATAEVFHGLLDRAASFGILTLGDLLRQAHEGRLRRHGRAGRSLVRLKEMAERLLRVRCHQTGPGSHHHGVKTRPSWDAPAST